MPPEPETLCEWKARNPLRAWRFIQSPRATIHDTAAALNVGASMIQMWENGVHKPAPVRHPDFAALLGVDWSHRWDNWRSSRPKLIQEGDA